MHVCASRCMRMYVCCWYRYVEVSIVVTMSYLVFWLGEIVMGSSAVLAVVVMGFTVNFYKETISPNVLHFLHEVCAAGHAQRELACRFRAHGLIPSQR